MSKTIQISIQIPYCLSVHLARKTEFLYRHLDVAVYSKMKLKFHVKNGTPKKQHPANLSWLKSVCVSVCFLINEWSVSSHEVRVEYTYVSNSSRFYLVNTKQHKKIICCANIFWFFCYLFFICNLSASAIVEKMSEKKRTKRRKDVSFQWKSHMLKEK